MDRLLTSDGQSLEIRMNDPYQDIWTLRDYPGFFMAKDSIVQMPLPPSPSSDGTASPDRMWCIQSAKDSTDFTKFFNQWKTPTGSNLYRGIAGCHFCWPKLRSEGVLESEGSNDIPMATMDNKQKTCWLPAAWDIGTAEGCALSCLGKAKTPVITYLQLMYGPNKTMQLTSDRSAVEVVTKAVPCRFPAGIVVKIPVRLYGPISICWLNSCETVVKGPLNSTQFSIYEIAWLTAYSVEFGRKAMRPQDLFPERPYEPTDPDWFMEWRKGNSYWLTQTVI
jgi:hypothetical protein